MTRWTKNLACYLALACGALFYLPLGGRALWDSDEGRYAEIAREMLQLKDWITPHLNYVVYLEKPPLMYWLTAGALRVFGLNAFAARFWCATFGLLTVLVTYRFGKLWRSERAGLLAGCILATSLGFFALTQFLVLDMALTFWTTLVLLAVSRLFVESAVPETRRAVYLAAVALAGGMLTKGPVALVLPLGALATLATLTGHRLSLSGIPWAKGLLLGALLTAPWFIAVSLRQPVFPRFFFVHEHVLRYLTVVHHRSAPWYFFAGVMIAGFLPWTVFLPKVAASWVRHRFARLRQDLGGALLAAWIVVVAVFFSVSQSKLAGYILPVFPALALWVARELDEVLDGEIPAWLWGGAAALGAIFLVALGVFNGPRVSSLAADPRWDLMVGQRGPLTLVLGLGLLVLISGWRTRQPAVCIGSMALAQVLLLTGLASAIHVLDPYQSSRLLAQRIRVEAGGNDPVVAYGCSYENVLQTLTFYVGRRVAVFGPPGELALGASLDPEGGRWFASEDKAKPALLAMPAGTWGVTDREHWEDLKNTVSRNTFHLVDRSGDLLLFRKER